MTRQGLGQVKAAALLALAFVSTTGCGRDRADKSLDVGGAHIVLPPVPGRPATLYFVVDAAETDPAAKPHRLVAVTVEGAERAEMHQSMTMDDMAQMRPLASVPLPPGVTRFCPGGNHVMLFGLGEKLKPGARTRVHLRLEGGRHLDPDAMVVAFGDAVVAEAPFSCS